jgi:hypothetical protein
VIHGTQRKNDPSVLLCIRLFTPRRKENMPVRYLMPNGKMCIAVSKAMPMQKKKKPSGNLPALVNIDFLPYIY